MEDARQIKRKQEYEQIAGTSYWQDLMTEIKRRGLSAKNRCATDTAWDAVCRAQGEALGYAAVLGLTYQIAGVEAPGGKGDKFNV